MGALTLCFQNCGKLGSSGASGGASNSLSSTVAVAPTPSAEGTTSPFANQIVDSQLNVWTIKNGASYKNGVSTGTSDIIMLLYYGGIVYQESTTASWTAWSSGTGGSGGSWVTASGDPRPNLPKGSPAPSPTPMPSPTVGSPSGTLVPTAAQLVDSQGNVWTLTLGNVYENAVHVSGSGILSNLLYYQGVVWGVNAVGSWNAWNGTGWVRVAGDPRTVDDASANGLTVPLQTQLLDSMVNVWTLTDAGVVYKNGVAAGFSEDVVLLLYYNQTIFQENNSSGWWYWNGKTWVTTVDPR